MNPHGLLQQQVAWPISRSFFSRSPAALFLSTYPAPSFQTKSPHKSQHGFGSSLHDCKVLALTGGKREHVYADSGCGVQWIEVKFSPLVRRGYSLHYQLSDLDDNITLL